MFLSLSLFIFEIYTFFFNVKIFFTPHSKVIFHPQLIFSGYPLNINSLFNIFRRASCSRSYLYTGLLLCLLLLCLLAFLAGILLLKMFQCGRRPWEIALVLARVSGPGVENEIGFGIWIWIWVWVWAAVLSFGSRVGQWGKMEAYVEETFIFTCRKLINRVLYINFLWNNTKFMVKKRATCRLQHGFPLRGKLHVACSTELRKRLDSLGERLGCPTTGNYIVDAMTRSK